MTPDESRQQGHGMNLLVEVSDEALETACNGSMQRSPAENIAADRGELGRHRSVYDGNGEDEFAIARHYVPQYSKGGGF